MFVNQSGDPSCACFFLGSCEKKNTSASPFSFFTQYMLQRVFLSAFPSVWSGSTPPSPAVLLFLMIVSSKWICE